jgi:polysaccharide deacetylase 2 family uncharacterized protein YibQ
MFRLASAVAERAESFRASGGRSPGLKETGFVTDDLSLPLGTSVRRRSLLPIPPFLLIAGSLGFLTAIVLGWLLFVKDPRASEPFAVVAIEKSGAKQKSEPAAPPPAASARDPVENKAAAIPAGAQTVTIIDGKSGARQEVVVRNVDPAAGVITAKLQDGLEARSVDPRLVEVSRHGAIPRVGNDGARPLDLYASAAAAAADRKLPRIAIVVGGLGIGGGTTAEAIGKLPDSITLAFAPYGGDLSRWAARARGGGHEIVLQLPMEPFDYPDNDPGPQTLLSTLTPEQNIDRLHWMLSRMQGYVGVTNYMGARFTSNDAALGAVLRDIGKRGLLYLDDGSSPRSIAMQSAATANAPSVKADLVVDATPNWADIDAALAKLETIAAERGVAVGTASALPLSIERIARWAKAAKERGIRIVPLSAILPKAKQS